MYILVTQFTVVQSGQLEKLVSIFPIVQGVFNVYEHWAHCKLHHWVRVNSFTQAQIS